uniref:OBP30 n=1 Tax=Episyrphus balteatus TaxID=286459 RepID=A0A6H0D4A6_EPIBA|nr:OBP30 [Episyrphus balteatus]
MKFFIIFIAFIVVFHNTVKAFSEEGPKIYMAECRDKFNITSNLAHYTLIIGEITEDTATEDEKCYLNCFLEKLGVLSDGELQEDAQGLKDYIGNKSAKKAIERCREEFGFHKCETAIKLHRCFLGVRNYAITQIYSS